jgi:hypothetical protein
LEGTHTSSVDESPCRKWAKLALERSERISSASRKSLESFFGGSWDRVSHVPHGGRPSFLAQAAAGPLRIALASCRGSGGEYHQGRDFGGVPKCMDRKDAGTEEKVVISNATNAFTVLCDMKLHAAGVCSSRRPQTRDLTLLTSLCKIATVPCRGGRLLLLLRDIGRNHQGLVSQMGGFLNLKWHSSDR